MSGWPPGALLDGSPLRFLPYPPRRYRRGRLHVGWYALFWAEDCGILTNAETYELLLVDQLMLGQLDGARRVLALMAAVGLEDSA